VQLRERHRAGPRSPAKDQFQAEAGGQAVQYVGAQGSFAGEEFVEGDGWNAGLFGNLVEGEGTGVDGAAEFAAQRGYIPRRRARGCSG
jgi:hypothetical protein